MGDSKTFLLTLPSRLWHAYVGLLWDPPQGSWVDRSAKTFRVLAFLVVFPFLVLTLIDIMSYIVARTLGVVETTRASTSDKRAGLAEPYTASGAPADTSSGELELEPEPEPEPEPQLVVEFVDRELQLSSQEPSRSSSRTDLAAESRSATPTKTRVRSASAAPLSESSHGETEMASAYEQPSPRVPVPGLLSDSRKPVPLSPASPLAMSSPGSFRSQKARFKDRLSLTQLSPHMSSKMHEPEPCFFNPSDDTSLELSGANLLSPAVSRDASPSIERRRLQLTPIDQDRDGNDNSLSSDTDSSFIFLQRNFDDVSTSSLASPAFRRRVGDPSSIKDDDL